MKEETLPRIPLHSSLVRPVLLGGAEPEFTIINLTVIGMLLLGCGLHMATLITALMLATIVQTGFVMMAKADPQMLQVYRRYCQYQYFYSAQSSVQARPAFIPPAQNKR
jgi:type IV secretion system protein VirB3